MAEEIEFIQNDFFYQFKNIRLYEAINIPTTTALEIKLMF
jgi:hypothetical protein